MNNAERMELLNIPTWQAKEPVMIYEKDSPKGYQDYIPACGIDVIDYDVHADYVIQIARTVTRGNVDIYASSTKADFDEVVDYCIEHNVRIIATSFTRNKNNERVNAIKRFADWGGIWTSAVGNTDGHSVMFPASDPNTIGCSATNVPDCDGVEIDITLPSWWSTVRDDGRLASLNGTSATNPVSGAIISYILTAHPEYQLEDVRQFILDNSVDDKYEDYEHVFTYPNEEAHSLKIVMKIGSKDIVVDGIVKRMDTAPFINDSRTFVPIRFVAEQLGCNVEWDGETEEVTIER